MKALAIDTETTGTALWHGCKPFAVSMCNEKGQTWWWEWDVKPFTREVDVNAKDVEQIIDVLCNYDLHVFHNALFDIRGLGLIGVSLAQTRPGLSWDTIHDTMGMAHIVDSLDAHGLKHLALEHFNYDTFDEIELIEEVKRCRPIAAKKGWKVATVDMVPGRRIKEPFHWDYWLSKALNSKSTLLKVYGIHDAERTILLYKCLKDKLEKLNKWDLYKRECTLLPEIWAMENRGVHILPDNLKQDGDRLRGIASEAKVKVSRVAKVHKKPEFNIRSPKQVGDLLYRNLMGGSYLPFTPSMKQLRTDEATLESVLICHKQNRKATNLVNNILRHRHANKALTALEQYRDLAISGTLHPNANPWGTHTTRFSHTNPNQANVAKSKEGREEFALRQVFGPEGDTVWLCADYNQLELRILAVAARVPSMLQAFEEGYDFHRWAADEIERVTGKSIERSAAKAANFAVIYGAGPERLDVMTGFPGLGPLWFQTFPEVKTFQNQVIQQVRRRGYVETLYGYRLYVPRTEPYKGIDYIVQGTAGDILKLAMIEVGNLFHYEDPFGVIMTIHDELVFQLPQTVTKDKEPLRKIKKAMEAPGLQVGVVTPVDLSLTTTNWAEKKEVKL